MTGKRIEGHSVLPRPARRVGAVLVPALTLALLAGCAGIPFERVERVPVAGWDPVVVRTRFAAGLPERFDTENSIVFEFWGRRMAGLGYGTVDTRERTFAVVGLTHTGLKLFEVTGRGDDLETRFAIPELAARGDLAQAVGRDVQRIYFDLVPSGQAAVSRRRRELVFEETVGNRTVEHVFGGREARLLEKRSRVDGKLETTVGFYDYREREGRWRPFGVVLDNHRYGYRLIVRERLPTAPPGG